MIKLKVEIENGNSTAGLNLFLGCVDCMKTLGITVFLYKKGIFESQGIGFDECQWGSRNDH